ncbi:hypothetical protein GCM10010909_10490 [Acidocella aquatica]|uniref:Uncharacterized protein n=1 Tax=Acidocella aquatica TaxID=1922313 RepID=A0ABQ6A1M0_9PROT|nr:hypothetical protein [Acidocella aquatica]GLR66369.1 hypothetical protein GCM10010909_10490 [Acidocella aquatica]
MSSAGPPFKRIVVDLHCSGCDRLIVQQAAEFAQMLQLELFGRFFADPAPARLAALPFAREFRVGERAWAPLEGDNVSLELSLAIAAAERLFTQMSAAAAIPRRFQIIHDQDVLEQPIDGRGESIAVIHQSGYASESFDRTLESAFQTAASVLILPGGAAPKSGPILAVITGPNDPAAGIAAALASAAGERLLRLDAQAGTAAQVPDARLIVARRGTFSNATLALIAARKKTPVLVVDTEPA